MATFEFDGERARKTEAEEHPLQFSFNSIMEDKAREPVYQSQDDWAKSTMTLADVVAVAKTTESYRPANPFSMELVRANSSLDSHPLMVKVDDEVWQPNIKDYKRTALAENVLSELKGSWDGFLPTVFNQADGNKLAVANMLDKDKTYSFCNEYVSSAKANLFDYARDGIALGSSGIAWFAASRAVNAVEPALPPAVKFAAKGLSALIIGGVFNNSLNERALTDSTGYLRNTELLGFVGGATTSARILGLGEKAALGAAAGVLAVPAIDELKKWHNADAAMHGQDEALRKALYRK